MRGITYIPSQPFNVFLDDLNEIKLVNGYFIFPRLLFRYWVQGYFMRFLKSEK